MQPRLSARSVPKADGPAKAEGTRRPTGALCSKVQLGSCAKVVHSDQQGFLTAYGSVQSKRLSADSLCCGLRVEEVLLTGSQRAMKTVTFAANFKVLWP